MDEAKEAAGGVVVAGGNPTAVLQAVDATLDAIAQGVDGPPDAVLDTAVPLGGDLRLSERMNPGVPRVMNRSASTSMTSTAFSLRPTRITSVAAIIAMAVNTDGKREIVGLHIGPSEAETFWSTFLKSLVRRGLRGTKLVISDAHEGLKAAIRRVMGSTWQRCRVHWMRNAQAYVPKCRWRLGRLT